MTGGGQRRRSGRLSVRLRLTLIATAIVGLVACLGVLGLYRQIYQMVHDDLRERGTTAATDLAGLARSGALPADLPIEVSGFYLLQVIDDSGRVLASSSALRGRPAMISRAGGAHGKTVTRIVTVPRPAERAYVAAQRVTTPAGPRTLLAGASLSELKQARQTFIALSVVTLPLLLALVWWIIWTSVGRALRPVHQMRWELAEVTGGRLDRRVSVPDTADEVAELAEAVNVTLERLQRFVEGQRAFVADASHELRSPLAGLRAQLEVALANPEDEDWPAVALAALADADRLQRIVADLLMLAKLDAGVRSEREPLDLGELARAEAARRTRRVPVDVRAEPGVVISATRGHLERLLGNLLDNAERHARSQVRVRVAAGDQAVLEVQDDGSGIPEEDRERVFQRFQRLEESRKRDSGGTGLGLAIARDIATAHGGTLSLADSDQGARFVLRLPLKELRVGGR